MYKGFFALIGLVALGQAHAVFNNFAIAPANPVAGQEVLLVFDAVFPNTPTGWNVSQAGNTFEVFVTDGTRIIPNPPVIEERISLGIVSTPGDYMVNPTFSAFGAFPPLSFIVSPAVPVPTLSPLGILLLVFSFAGVVMVLNRGRGLFVMVEYAAGPVQDSLGPRCGSE